MIKFPSVAAVAAALVAAVAPASAEPREQVENLVNVSWGDQIMVARGDAQLDTPERIRRAMRGWLEQFDGRTVLWRASAIYLDRFYEKRTNASPFARAYAEKTAEIKNRFTPIEVARRTAAENGQQFLVYMTIFDHGAPPSVLYAGETPFPWQDRVTKENPEYQAVDLRGNYHYGVLEMANPDARRFMIGRIRDFVEEFDTDGVYVCTRSHSVPALHADQYGFSPQVVDAYRERYGIDISRDPRFDYQSPQYDPTSEVVENWRKLRGEFLVQFYRELREALPGKTIYTGIPRGRYIGPPYGNLYLDWESLAREELVDGLVVGVYSNRGLHPKLYVPHATIGYLSSEDDAIGLPTLDAALDGIYGPVTEEAGVKLFYDSGSYGPQHQRQLAAHPTLDGFMIVTPTTSGGRAVIPHHDALDFPGGQMTVDARLHLSRLPEKHEGAPRILSKYGHHDGGRHRGWEWILMPDGRLQFRINFGEDSDPLISATEASIISPEPLPVGRWFHAATVYDRASRQIRMFIDGQKVMHLTIPDLPLRRTPWQDLYIARYGAQDTAHFHGTIDELRLTAAALDFAAPPSQPYSGDEPDTVALYHFDSIGPTFSVENAKDPTVSRMQVIGGGDSLLIDAPDGFGRAFRTYTTEEADAGE